MKAFHDYGIVLPAGAAGEVDLTCPECSQGRKKKRVTCLSVNVDKGTWVCHHCGWKGGLNSGGKATAQLHWRKPEYRKPDPFPKTEISQKARAFLNQRGITDAVISRYEITDRRVYIPQIEGHANAIVFPYFRNGELINTKYRDGEKNFRMEAGCERILYGVDDINPACVVIVEGEMDKLSHAVAGITSCVSVPDGAPSRNAKNYASKFAYLENLPEVNEWIIAVDADEPGRCLEEELARRFGVEKCRRVVWPEGCKDANDVLVKHGKEVLAECIKHAQPYPVAGVYGIDDIRDQVVDLYHHGMEPGLLAGLGEFDRFFSVRPGEVTVITGIPNSGKSEFLEYLAVRLAGIHGWRFAVFSPEHQPMHMHASRIIEKFLRKPFFRNVDGHMDEACLQDGLEFAQESFFWIQPPNVEDWSLEIILEKAGALVARQGIRGLIIDPFNELESLRPERQTETEYIGQCLKRIRQFALSRGVHVFVVAHPQKLYRDKNGNYPIPSMYDISGSAHWRNKADNGLCVWRDLAGGEFVEIHVQKVRFKHTGRIGTAQLRFDRATGTYEAA